MFHQGVDKYVKITGYLLSLGESLIENKNKFSLDMQSFF